METTTAKITVDQLGRYINFGGKVINIHDLAFDQGFDPEENEDLWNHQCRCIEDTVLDQLGITHIVSFEDFGNLEPHPVSSLCSL